MRGVATIDRQPGADQIAVWVTAAMGVPDVAHVNAVVMPADDPDALEKIRSLTRCSVVLATDGSTLEGLPIEGEVLHAADLGGLLSEAEAHQGRILEAITAYKRTSRSKTLVEPTFLDAPLREHFEPIEDTATARAFSTANYLLAAWRVWLKTDDERVRRTIQPRTGQTPWIMPEDMNEPKTPPFPPEFAARLTEQALV